MHRDARPVLGDRGGCKVGPEDLRPERGELSASYAEEASKARGRRSELEAHADELRLIHTPDGQTLYEWVLEFLDSGDRINNFLKQRAGEDSAASRAQKAQAMAIRSETIGLLNQLRDALAKEIEMDSKYPVSEVLVNFLAIKDHIHSP